MIYLVILWFASFFTAGIAGIGILIYEFLKLEKLVDEANNPDDSLGKVSREEGKQSRGFSTSLRENQNTISMKEKDNEISTLKSKNAEMGNKISELEIAIANAKIKVEENGLSELWEVENKVALAAETLANKENQVNSLNEKLEGIKESTIYWQGILEEESLGMFTRPEELYPTEHYKEELKNNRDFQKELKKSGRATNAKVMTLDGSRTKGEKMQKDNVNQILRAFDNESDVFIKTVSLKNVASKEKALKRSFEQLNKINIANGVEILPKYLDLKEKELNLAHKGLLAREHERELLREQRELEREEQKAAQEIAKKKAVVDKDINHYDKMMKELQSQIAALQDDNKKLELANELELLEEQKESKEQEKKDLDFRNKNAKAGYVYIISNIGSFGENIFKIGVTRRLDPFERVSELSSASVPFKFDVHAMVFSNDAFKLESDLHKAFSDNRVNLVNNRKEFFNITIDDIKKELKQYENLTVNFTEKAEASDYRNSLKIKNGTLNEI